MADRLKCPLQFIQRWTTSTEFVEWMAFFEWEAEQELKVHKREEFFWAQIAQEVYLLRMQMAEKKGVVSRLSDFLIKFSRSGKKSKEVKQVEEDDKPWSKERQEVSRMYWTALVQHGAKAPPQQNGHSNN